MNYYDMLLIPNKNSVPFFHFKYLSLMANYCLEQNIKNHKSNLSIVNKPLGFKITYIYQQLWFHLQNLRKMFWPLKKIIDVKWSTIVELALSHQSIYCGSVHPYWCSSNQQPGQSWSANKGPVCSDFDIMKQHCVICVE